MRNTNTHTIRRQAPGWISTRLSKMHAAVCTEPTTPHYTFICNYSRGINIDAGWKGFNSHVVVPRHAVNKTSRSYGARRGVEWKILRHAATLCLTLNLDDDFCGINFEDGFGFVFALSARDFFFAAAASSLIPLGATLRQGSKTENFYERAR